MDKFLLKSSPSVANTTPSRRSGKTATSVTTPTSLPGVDSPHTSTSVVTNIDTGDNEASFAFTKLSYEDSTTTEHAVVQADVVEIEDTDDDGLRGITPSPGKSSSSNKSSAKAEMSDDSPEVLPSTPAGCTAVTPSTARSSTSSKKRRLTSAEKAQREEDKARREAERQQKKQEMEQKKQQKEEEKKERERIQLEKKQERERERERKEKEKEEQRLQKELRDKEREAQRQERDAQKQQKEQERIQKEQEKAEKERQKQEEENLKKKKAERQKNYFISFFADGAKPAKRDAVVLGSFELKEGMYIPLERRQPLSEGEKRTLDDYIVSSKCASANDLYVVSLQRMGRNYKKRNCDRTLPRSTDSALDADCILADNDAQKTLVKTKYLHFHDNYRPPYYGTWRQRCTDGTVSGRRPVGRSLQPPIDYDVDSDAEWEAEPDDGIDCDSNDGVAADKDDDEVAAVVDEDDDGFFVEHGYLSEGEGEDEPDENDPNVSMDAESRRQRMVARAETWKVEKLNRKFAKLKPLVIGPIWLGNPGANYDQQLVDKLNCYRMITLGSIVTGFDRAKTAAEKPPPPLTPVDVRSVKSSKRKSTTAVVGNPLIAKWAKVEDLSKP